MATPIQITATVPAWLYPHHRIDTLLERVREGKPITDMLSFWTWDLSAPDRSSEPYTRIGEAQITVTLSSPDEMVQARIKAHQNELEAARAAFLQKQQEILERISKLSAIEYVQEQS